MPTTSQNTNCSLFLLSSVQNSALLILTLNTSSCILPSILASKSWFCLTMLQEQIYFSSSCFFRLKGGGFLQDYEKFLWKFFSSLALCESLQITRKQLQHHTYILWAVNTLFSHLGIVLILNTQSWETNLESVGSHVELGQAQITETEKRIKWHSAGEALWHHSRSELKCFISIMFFFLYFRKSK